MVARSAGLRDAGYDTILFEGPGQGAALELAHLTMTPEWEKPVKAVLDYFRLDAVTLMGFSLGGGWSFAPPPSSQGCAGSSRTTL